MRAVRWTGPDAVDVAEVEPPSLQEPDDAILRVSTSAICGSDLHLYHGKLPKVRPGTVIGHEFMGTIEAMGPAVRMHRPGERCVAAMYTACGRCPRCLAGQHQRCPRYAMFGCGELFGDLAGGQAELVRVPLADMTLTPVPAELADADALFVGDILATAYTACLEAALQPGESVAVVGVGPVGQLVLECLPLFGPGAVYAVDVLPERLRRAAALGAIPLDAAGGDPLARLRELNAGRRVDAVLEVVGSASALETAWRLVDTGGRVVLVGLLVDEPFPQSAGQTWLRNLSVRSVLGRPYAHRGPLLRLIAQGRLHPAGIVSERVPLDAAPDAYRRLAARQTSKVLLQP